MKNIVKVIFLLAGWLAGWLVLPSTALARDQFFGGQVFVTVDQRGVDTPIGLDGVIIYREDRHSWSSHRGVISVSLNQAGSFGELGSLEKGGYGFLYNRSIGEGLTSECGGGGHCCGNRSCPVILLGGKISEARCVEHYHCGLSCGERNPPHRVLAYFPTDYDFGKLPPGIGYLPGDIKGGGSWQIHSNGADRVRVGGTDFTFNTSHFGQVTYGSGEWMQVDTISNQGGRKNVDIEWIPPGNYSCTDLTSSAQGEVGVGNKLIFTCSSSIDNDLNFDGYNYRIHRPSDPVDQWHCPDNWNDISGSTPEFEVTEVGSYKVQCQVCASFQGNRVCTDWGKANQESL